MVDALGRDRRVEKRIYNKLHSAHRCAVTSAWNKRHPERSKLNKWRSTLKLVYKITEQEYNALYNKQDGACAICKTKHPRLAVDHCHSTGTVRGLLCTKCNTGIGMFSDKYDLVKAAADYLQATAATVPAEP
jgi:hypothetical protein